MVKFLNIIDHGGLKASNAADPSTSGGLTTKNYVDSNFQPLDGDLTAIGGLTPTDGDMIQRRSGVWVNRSIAQVMADMAFQPLDSDLTTIAGLSPTTDNLIQSVAGAWASRTPSQVRTVLGVIPGTDVQVQSADLSAIAALGVTNDSIIQGKAGSWAKRTVAQFLADLIASSASFPGRELGYTAFSTSVISVSTTASVVDIAGATITITVGSRPILVKFYAYGTDTTVAGDGRVNFSLKDVTASNVEVGGATVDAGNSTTVILEARLNPSAGSRTYKVQWSTNGGGTTRLLATSTKPSWMQVVEL